MKRAPLATFGLVAGLAAQGALAGTVDRSLRPVERPPAAEVARVLPATPAPVAEEEIVGRAAIGTASFSAPPRSLRPSPRPATLSGQTPPTQPAGAEGSQSGLLRWLAEFKPRAQAAGITEATFREAFRGVRYDPDVVRRDRNQSEFTKTLWDYLGSAASDARIANGRAALRTHDALLRRIERRYGVEKEVVVAIWGLESAYGSFRGSDPVIGSMATLAYDGRRRAFFEDELIAALTILQDGHTTPAAMNGSWAGAMGHTQFMPTSFQRLAVDFTGDGKRDIWGDDPADALASTANYLAKNGWKAGQPWGVEVRLPDGFDYALADRNIRRAPAEWARLGVTDMDGRAVANFGQASILVPAGHRGTALMIFDNFAVIERYNTADSYVIGVGHLSDRLRGAGPFRGGWPEGDRALTYDERTELQRRLTAAGFDTQGIDGRIGPLTIDAVRDFQRSAGLVPDGYANPALLQRLRQL